MRTSLLSLLLVVSPSLAAEPPAPSPAARATAKGSVPSLGLSSVGTAIPKGEGVTTKEATKLGAESTVKARPDARYDVVAIQHARGFTASAGGHVRNGAELRQIALKGHPPATEAFSTLIRIRSESRQPAPIDVVILDPRGDTAMTSSGELRFSDKDKDTVGYTVDWESTPARSPGEFNVLVRVAGKPLGTWPLQVVAGGK